MIPEKPIQYGSYLKRPLTGSSGISSLGKNTRTGSTES